MSYEQNFKKALSKIKSLESLLEPFEYGLEGRNRATLSIRDGKISIYILNRFIEGSETVFTIDINKQATKQCLEAEPKTLPPSSSEILLESLLDELEKLDKLAGEHYESKEPNHQAIYIEKSTLFAGLQNISKLENVENTSSAAAGSGAAAAAGASAAPSASPSQTQQSSRLSSPSRNIILFHATGGELAIKFDNKECRESFDNEMKNIWPKWKENRFFDSSNNTIYFPESEGRGDNGVYKSDEKLALAFPNNDIRNKFCELLNIKHNLKFEIIEIEGGDSFEMIQGNELPEKGERGDNAVYFDASKLPFGAGIRDNNMKLEYKGEIKAQGLSK